MNIVIDVQHIKCEARMSNTKYRLHTRGAVLALSPLPFVIYTHMQYGYKNPLKKHLRSPMNLMPVHHRLSLIYPSLNLCNTRCWQMLISESPFSLQTLHMYPIALECSHLQTLNSEWPFTKMFCSRLLG